MLNFAHSLIHFNCWMV